LVGYSMGAIVAGKVAATHPERVLSIVYGGQAPIFKSKDKRDAHEIEVFAKAVEEGKGKLHVCCNRALHGPVVAAGVTCVGFDVGRPTHLDVHGECLQMV
jgi:pimeloyl-ACP methyl ester carboxylesterase